MMTPVSHAVATVHYADSESVNRFINRLGESVLPSSNPEDQPNQLYRKMLEAVADYQKSSGFTSDLRRYIESLIDYADQESANGDSPRAMTLTHELAWVKAELKRAFPRDVQVLANRLRTEINAKINELPIEHQQECQLRLSQIGTEPCPNQRARFLTELRRIDEPLARKLMLLNDITARPMELSRRYERIGKALKEERAIASQLRCEYAELLMTEADRARQIRALTIGKAYFRLARELLRTAAYTTRALLKDEAFLQLAERAGLDDLLRLGRFSSLETT